MKIIKFILINLLIVLSILGVMELSTRTFSWISGNGFHLALHELEGYDKEIESLYRWHPFVGFIHKPNNVIIGSHPNQKEKSFVYVDKNSFLVQGPDENIELEKGSDVIRIVTIGGSTTAGVNLSYEENWPGYLGYLVQQQFPEKKIEVINAGVSGYDTSECIGNLALRVLPFKPDVVIIYQTFNDLKAVKVNDEFKADYSHIHTTPHHYYRRPNFLIQWLNHSMTVVRIRNQIRKSRERLNNQLEVIQIQKNLRNRLTKVPDIAVNTFEDHMRTMVYIAESAGAKVVLSTYASLHDPADDWAGLSSFNQLSDFQKDNLGSLLLFTPGLNFEGIFDGFKKYNSAIRDVVAQENVSLVDNAVLIPHSDAYFVDHVHFSRNGARKMAENLLPEVMKVLKDAEE